MSKVKKGVPNTLTIHKDSKKVIRESRELPHVCRFCVSAHTLYYGDTMLCDRKGIVSCEYCCAKFRYDPLKHQPAQTPNIIPFDETLLLIDDADECGGHPVLNENLVSDFSSENSFSESVKDLECVRTLSESESDGLPELVFTTHCSSEKEEAVVI